VLCARVGSNGIFVHLRRHHAQLQAQQSWERVPALCDGDSACHLMGIVERRAGLSRWTRMLGPLRGGLKCCDAASLQYGWVN
jgi:hypothetical protein